MTQGWSCMISCLILGISILCLTGSGKRLAQPTELDSQKQHRHDETMVTSMY